MNDPNSDQEKFWAEYRLARERAQRLQADIELVQARIDVTPDVVSRLDLESDIEAGVRNPLRVRSHFYILNDTAAEGVLEVFRRAGGVAISALERMHMVSTAYTGTRFDSAAQEDLAIHFNAVVRTKDVANSLGFIRKKGDKAGMFLQAFRGDLQKIEKEAERVMLPSVLDKDKREILLERLFEPARDALVTKSHELARQNLDLASYALHYGRLTLRAGCFHKAMVAVGGSDDEKTHYEYQMAAQSLLGVAQKALVDVTAYKTACYTREVTEKPPFVRARDFV